MGAGSDPRVTFEYKAGRVGAIILKRFIGGKVTVKLQRCQDKAHADETYC